MLFLICIYQGSFLGLCVLKNTVCMCTPLQYCTEQFAGLKIPVLLRPSLPPPEYVVSSDFFQCFRLSQKCLIMES